MEPKVSIIVPVYKVEEYLSQCVDSILNQTYKNIELILVDDGSPDNCPKICDEYASSDDRVIVIHKENGGLSDARNTGIKKATGKYLMFVDSDDWIELDTCKVAVETAEKEKADLVFWSYMREFIDESKPKFFFWDDNSVFEGEEAKNNLHRRICGLYKSELSHPDYAYALDTAWGKLYLSDHIKNNNIRFIDTKIIGTEDALFNLYALAYVNKAVYLKQAFSHYRKDNTASLTSNNKPRLYLQWNRLIHLMYKYIKERKLDETYYVALHNRIALNIVGLGLNELANKDHSFFQHYLEIRKYVNHTRFNKACRQMEVQYLPLPWKILMLCCRYKLSLSVLLIIYAIKKLK